MDKHTKNQIKEELDLIAKLEARARLAREMFILEVAEGVEEDIIKRKTKLKHRIESGHI